MGLIDDSSILMSIKRLLNVEPDEMDFDTQIGMFINEEFMTLHQLGIGPEEGFSINDADTKWRDFSDDATLINTVKTYIYYRVRLAFDPPASSIVSDAINSRISELQFRLNAQAERNWKDDTVYPDDDPWDDDGECCCKDKKNYKIDGENLIIFESPTRLEEAGEP